jgi:membrane associated rhomboid family serine protease
MDRQQIRDLLSVLFFPVYFVAALWLAKFTEYVFGLDLIQYGIVPREIKGLIGILTSPFIHKDLDHLTSNSFPLLFLGMGLFYFYKPLAYRLYFWIYLLSGVGTWLIGRPSFHIGASGIVYGFASFIFFSGAFRREPRLMSISLLVVFLYGSMVWYMFPFRLELSWEGHLMGGLSGLLMALIYRKEGPQRQVYEWEDEEENEDEEGENPDRTEGETAVIRYIYIENTDEQKNRKNGFRES